MTSLRQSRWLSAILPGLALVALVLLACRDAPEEGSAPETPAAFPKPDVVLIVIDTLRADHLPTYGYSRPTAPVIDAFAEESLVFENAFTVMGLTLPAHVSMMTGLDPRTHGTVSNFVEPDGRHSTLAEQLQSQGYVTAAFVSGAPLARKHGLAKGFEVYSDTRNAAGEDAPRIPGEKTTERAIAWLESQEDSPRPFFLFVHYYDTHTHYIRPTKEPLPFRVDTELRKRMDTLGLSKLEISDLSYSPILENGVPLNLALAINAYDNQIRRVDGLVGLLLSALEKTGRFDHTLVIITSDHGEGLGQHDYYEHHLNLYEEQLRIPLIIRPPASTPFPPQRVSRIASLVDIAPSVLDWTGVPTQVAFQGQSLRPGDAKSSEHETRWLVACRPAFGKDLRKKRGEKFSAQNALCATRGEKPIKYLVHGDGREELYDLAKDPHELRNLAKTNPNQLLRMRGRLGQILTREKPSKAVAKPVSEAQRKALEALGYVE